MFLLSSIIQVLNSIYIVHRQLNRITLIVSTNDVLYIMYIIVIVNDRCRWHYRQIAIQMGEKKKKKNKVK